jgi:hypothetical protein
MSKFVLKGTRIFAGGCDLTGQTNKVELGGEYETKDATTFGSVDAAGELWKDVLAGLGSASVSASGFWEAGDAAKVDNDTWTQIGTGAGGPWTICPTTANAADLAYLLAAARTSYSQGGAPGDVAPYASQAVSTWPLARGKVLNAPGTARTATGTGTIVQVGAVPAGKSMYVSLHVVSATGTTPSITVAVQSAALVGFGSPTTRLTFTAATAPGGQILRVAGPITDAFWRVSYTVSGTTPSFLLLAAAGVA